MKKSYLATAFIFLMLSSFAVADVLEIPVFSGEPSFSIGQTSNWTYLNFVKKDASNDYLAFNNNELGAMGIAKDGKVVGGMYLVPAFRQPITLNWYACPLTGLSGDIDYGPDYIHLGSEDDSVTCYSYSDTSSTANAVLDSSITIQTTQAEEFITSLKANVSITSLLPVNTGFGYFFYPRNPAKFKKVLLSSGWLDIDGSPTDIEQNYVLRFGDVLNNHLGFDFDWSDMPEGSFFSEIITFGSKTGLLVGTYGYGASTDIMIDPIFNVSINSTFPSYHLRNGTNDFSSRDQYANFTENSSTMSITGDGGLFSARLGQSIFLNNLFFGFTMNEIQGPEYHDHSIFNNDGDFIASPNVLAAGVEYTGVKLDGSSQYGLSPASSNLDVASNEHIFFCTSFNTSVNFGVNKGLITRRSVVDGFSMSMLNDESVRCRVSRGISTAVAISPLGGYNNGRWHTACCFGNATSGGATLYIDGSEVDSDTGSTGDISNNLDLYIGSTNLGGGKYEGQIDEVCGMKTSGTLDPSSLAKVYNQTYCVNETKGFALQAFFNQTINTLTSNWSLKVVAPLSDIRVYRVWSMLNTTHINTTKYKDFTSGGLTSFLNLASLNLVGYNSALRVSTLNDNNLSIDSVTLLQVVNDSGAPSINDCYFSDTQVNCSESTVLVCNITDDTGVESVLSMEVVPTSIDANVSINVTDVHILVSNASDTFVDVLSPGHFTSELDSVGWTYSEPINFSVTQVNATDIVGNRNVTNYALNQVYVEYVCLACVEGWVEDTPSCRINNTYISTYTDSNGCGTTDDLPAQNGTEQACNYCSEDLQQNIGVCIGGGTQPVNYTDLNYTTCCAVTGLSSDCSVDHLYPFNETTSQSCQFGSSDLGVPQCPEQFNFRIEEKEYCLVEIPQNYTNESFKCISYVVDGTSLDILQTNPEYKERSNSFFDFLRGNPESREYFTPANGLVNFYLTEKNLKPEHDYYLNIKCRSEQRMLESSHFFNTGYEDLSFVFFRTRWAKANVSYIIAALFLIAFLLVAFAVLRWIWK